MCGSEVTGWLSHAYGEINLLLAAGPKICESELGKTLLYACLGQAWQQGLFCGKPSVFDSPSWLNIDPPQDSEDYQSTGKPRLHVLTRIARLISLVRLLRAGGFDTNVVSKATILAKQLLQIEWSKDTAVPPIAIVISTQSTEDAKLIPLSLHCASGDYFTLMRYATEWKVKIMLSGLCQVLYAYNAELQWPTLIELRQEERRCALLICMSADNAMKYLPLGGMQTLSALQVAWGVYYRQRNVPDGIDAAAMMDWVFRRINFFLYSFSGFHMHVEGLRFFTERLVGGSVSSYDVFEDAEQFTNVEAGLAESLRPKGDQDDDISNEVSVRPDRTTEGR